MRSRAIEHADTTLTGGSEDSMERVLRLRERSSLSGVLLEKSRKLRLREKRPQSTGKPRVYRADEKYPAARAQTQKTQLEV